MIFSVNLATNLREFFALFVTIRAIRCNFLNDHMDSQRAKKAAHMRCFLFLHSTILRSQAFGKSLTSDSYQSNRLRKGHQRILKHIHRWAH